MLNVEIQRVLQREDGTRDYIYSVYVNRSLIDRGVVYGHDPKTGWVGLLQDLATQQHPRSRI